MEGVVEGDISLALHQRGFRNKVKKEGDYLSPKLVTGKVYLWGDRNENSLY